MTTKASDTVTCPCEDCVCKVSTDKAVMKDGRAFCCEECAAGHIHHAGCEHDGCACHG